MKARLVLAVQAIAIVAFVLAIAGMVISRSQVNDLRSDLKAVQAQQDAMKKNQAELQEDAASLQTVSKSAEDLTARLGKVESQAKTLDQAAKDAKGYGLCVETQFVNGYTWVTSVDTPSVLNGAKQCFSGTFVAVAPAPYTP